jgi:antitoxin VapB
MSIVVLIRGGVMPRAARLFMDGASQAVRLSADFRFEGSEVPITREGDRVVLSPLENSLADFITNGPRASSNFLQDAEDFPVQEREVS